MLSDAKKRARLRPVRPRRRRPLRRLRRRRSGAAPRASAASRMRSATSSARSSARSAAAAAAASIAAPTCATTSSCRSRKPRAAPRPRSAFRRWRNARPATAPAPSPGRSPRNARRCDGRGEVRVSQGFFSIQQTCPTCHGTGKVIADPCATCHGAGRVKKHKTLSVKIPAGVDQDDRIRLTGEGEAGVNGGPPGDLYVVVNLKPHTVFQREGADLHCEMPISFATAALGGEIEIPDARRPRQDQDSGRDADGPGVPAARQGHQAGARLAATATSSATSRSKRRSSSRRGRRNCCASSRRSTTRTPARTIRAPSRSWTRCASSSARDPSPPTLMPATEMPIPVPRTSPGVSRAVRLARRRSRVLRFAAPPRRRSRSA